MARFLSFDRKRDTDREWMAFRVPYIVSTGRKPRWVSELVAPNTTP